LAHRGNDDPAGRCPGSLPPVALAGAR